ncbi:hypothetical protein SAMN05216567_12848 [Variovorax sp. OK605]|uniref:hypothetical protein n=1 Tax=Variovorax sp. OK605 TaxID=1855317 RepID=UPI0008E60E5C|nr:hypothetical protein [Variovorax sp. OK605]SFQ70806.1 hypothetical protein SAMN05216567_12848 [Variovorax sp. OK605]
MKKPIPMMDAEQIQKAKRPLTEDETKQHAEFERFFTELVAESDRAAVILGAAKIDALLFQLLAGVLLPSDTKADELLGQDKPLGTFSARATICYRLGLIDKDLLHAITLVRRIRNDFAHRLRGVSLTSGENGNRVRDLIAPLRASSGFEWLTDGGRQKIVGPAMEFRAAISLLYLRLEGACDARPTVYLPVAMPLLAPNWRDEDLE